MNYQMGYVKAETKKELGEKVIEHVGLKLEDDENIGKKVRFKNPEFPAEMEIYTIVARQKLWGHNEEGKYTMIDGYRGVSKNNQFGRPLALNKIEFIKERKNDE